jgi:hypothetical protein
MSQRSWTGLEKKPYIKKKKSKKEKKKEVRTPNQK